MAQRRRRLIERNVGQVQPTAPRPDRAGISPGLQAIRQQYGAQWRPEAGGPTLKLNEQNATRMMNGLFRSEQTQAGAPNPNYRPPGSAAGVDTNFANAQGNRMGTWMGTGGAGSFQIAGGRPSLGPGNPVRPTDGADNRMGNAQRNVGGFPNKGGNATRTREGGRGNQGKPTHTMPNGQQMAGASHQGAAFPEQPPAPPSFLPMTTGFLDTMRGADDALYNAQAAYTKNASLIDPMLQYQLARMGTDKGYAENALNEQLAERGLVGSGPQAYLQTRDVAIPYGRGVQDLSMGAAQSYADLASGLGQANLGYNQSMVEALLQRAYDAAQQMGATGSELPAFGYDLPGRTRTGRGNRSNRRANRRRNRGRK